jgi:hypothetical protein
MIAAVHHTEETDPPGGAVIGSREFVNEAFASARVRFGPKREDEAKRGNSRATAQPQVKRCGACTTCVCEHEWIPL